MGDVEIKFENGQAQGSIKDEKDGNAEIFTIKGDTKQLEITPTESNRIIIAILDQNQKAILQEWKKQLWKLSLLIQRLVIPTKNT